MRSSETQKNVSENRFASAVHPNRTPEKKLTVTPESIFFRNKADILIFLSKLPSNQRQLVIAALWAYSVPILDEVELTDTDLEKMLQEVAQHQQ